MHKQEVSYCGGTARGYRTTLNWAKVPYNMQRDGHSIFVGIAIN